MSPALCAPGDGTAGAGLCGWAAWSAEGVVPAPAAWAVRKAGAQRGAGVDGSALTPAGVVSSSVSGPLRLVP